MDDVVVERQDCLGMAQSSNIHRENIGYIFMSSFKYILFFMPSIGHFLNQNVKYNIPYIFSFKETNLPQTYGLWP